MQIKISVRHGQLSEQTRERITEKLQKLPRLFERITEADVTVDLEPADQQKVEVRISLEHADDMVATAEAGNVLGLVDAAVHKLEKQLRKHKEKYITRRTAGRRNPPTPESPV